jgi:predicted patatin/cPLA2 family phospholipase
MRGAFGAGVQAGFAEAGLSFDAFDALYGSSAGALNLMYWVSRWPRRGTRVYLDELTRREDPAFLRYRTPLELFSKLFRGEPVMDLKAIERAMGSAQPIDKDAILRHHAPILFPLTRADNLTTDMLDVRSLSKDLLLPTLLAAAAVPVLCDHYQLEGCPFLDGAFAAPLPVTRALADGYSDLVVILTLPRWRRPAGYENWVLRALAGRRGVPARVARAVEQGRRARLEALRTLKRPPKDVNVTVIAPRTSMIRSLERRREWIHRIVEAGVDEGRGAVELSRLQQAP